MDWLKQLNEVLTYIEEHLDSDIDLDVAAKIACCSPYHFQRVFSYMAGVPLSEYIRRRRMTRAAFDLQSSDARIIDIALTYGYDSPTAFNRAFQNVHGIAPSAARRRGAALKAYPPISFKITIRGVDEMKYQIVEKDAFRIVGAKLTTSWTVEDKEAFTVIPKFWAEHHQKGTIPKLCSVMNAQPMGVMGISVGDMTNNGQFDYYIAVSSTQPAPEGMAELEIPAATWAIFECKGAMPKAIQELSERIMTEWLPNSGYEYANAPDIELYGEGDQTADDYVCWIWVPVQKKA